MKALGLILCIPLIASLYIYFFATNAVAQATGMIAQNVSITASLAAFALGFIVMMLENASRAASRRNKR